MAANENSASTTLDATRAAEAAFAATCGNGGYAPSFLVLGIAAAPGSPAFVGPDLGTTATPQKNGYNLTLQPGIASTAGPVDCHGKPTVSAWYATATPETFGATGSHSFAVTDRDGTWRSDSAVAPTEPFGPPAVRMR
jgi:hypothetical protein